MAGVADFQRWSVYMESRARAIDSAYKIPHFLDIVAELLYSQPDFHFIIQRFRDGEKIMYATIGFLIADIPEFRDVHEECLIHMGAQINRSHGNPFAPAPQAIPLPVPAPVAKSPIKQYSCVTISVDGKWVQEAKKPLDEIPEYAKPNPDICPCGIHYRQCRYHDDRNYAAAKGR